METLYTVCAVAGGTLVVCQFLMGLIGAGHHDADGGMDDVSHEVGHDHDTGHDAGHGHSWIIGVLTMRTLVAALTCFGLVGLAGVARDWDAPLTLLVALAAGAGAMALVAGLMRALHKLKAEGTARIERAVGTSGTVYLKIPAHKAGVGKVQLNLQNRTVEYQAVTARDELPTGAKIVVVAIVGADTVEVAPATSAVPTT